MHARANAMFGRRRKRHAGDSDLGSQSFDGSAANCQLSITGEPRDAPQSGRLPLQIAVATRSQGELEVRLMQAASPLLDQSSPLVALPAKAREKRANAGFDLHRHARTERLVRSAAAEVASDETGPV
jgi:hypothetical protein